jgi:hypothetical protein
LKSPKILYINFIQETSLSSPAQSLPVGSTATIRIIGRRKGRKECQSVQSFKESDQYKSAELNN